MSRTPQGAPGSILWMGKYGKKLAHVQVDKRDNTYIALFDGVFLGRYDEPDDAIDVAMDRGREYRRQQRRLNKA